MSGLLKLANLEQMEGLLMQLSALISAWEAGEPDFIAQAQAWLQRCEQSLLNNRLSAAGQFAALRGALLGQRASGSEPGARQATRRQREAQVAAWLKEGAELLATQLRARRGQVDEAERIMMQLLAVADHAGLIPPPQAGESHTAHLQTLMRQLAARPELGSHWAHLNGLLGSSDCLLMLDRVLTRLRS